jgi:hypothetical protein
VSDQKKSPPKTITEADIKTAPVDRRGVMGILTATAAGAVVGGAPRPAHAANDEDQGQGSDPPGAGRGIPRARRSNLTDRDPDGVDQAGNGRGGPDQRRQNIVDTDQGQNADPQGQGRGFSRNRLSNVTDQDPSADPPNNGRNVPARSGKG